MEDSTAPRTPKTQLGAQIQGWPLVVLLLLMLAILAAQIVVMNRKPASLEMSPQDSGTFQLNLNDLLWCLIYARENDPGSISQDQARNMLEILHRLAPGLNEAEKLNRMIILELNPTQRTFLSTHMAQVRALPPQPGARLDPTPDLTRLSRNLARIAKGLPVERAASMPKAAGRTEEISAPLRLPNPTRESALPQNSLELAKALNFLIEYSPCAPGPEQAGKLLPLTVMLGEIQLAKEEGEQELNNHLGARQRQGYLKDLDRIRSFKKLELLPGVSSGDALLLHNAIRALQELAGKMPGELPPPTETRIPSPPRGPGAGKEISPPPGQGVPGRGELPPGPGGPLGR